MVNPECKLTVLPHVDKVIDMKQNRATFKAKVSITNPYTCQVTVKTIYYTLKTVKKDREMVKGPFTENLPKQLEQQKQEMIQVPMSVRYEHLMKLTNDIGVDWDNMYELEFKLTVDLPWARDHPISRTTIAEIQMPL
ncbi:probable desiccation-related protein LEA14 [Vitis riparia]|uniref:probable desiccation-related protein LEA14 n=1 Tax=Vitis riparia TaxID=96939 RepID=UPI00155B1B65|nr:probable desiccation-related protein LEA14 [Vitis riparia]XP_034709793.1 probable desiccation-related protein LEA14 [Vitis riparia]